MFLTVPIVPVHTSSKAASSSDKRCDFAVEPDDLRRGPAVHGVSGRLRSHDRCQRGVRTFVGITSRLARR